jgi:sugar phosphate isomerase/epimerase
MRYGAMNFPVKPLIAEIDAIGALGLDFFELAMDPPQAHYSQVRAQRRAVLAALQHHHLELVCHMPTFVYTADLTDSIRHASLEEVLSSLETAADLGAAKAVLHPGYISGLAVAVMQQAVALAMESLGAVAQRAQALGMTLCIENLFPKFRPFADPADFQRLFDLFPQLKFVLDIGHAHMEDKSGRRIIDFIARHGHRLAHVHVSDNKGRTDDHLPVGQGNIDFAAFTQALRRSGYDDTLTLEIFVEDRTALLESRRRLERLLAR